MFSRFLGPRGEGLTRGDDPFGMLQREIGRVVEDAFRGMPLRGFTPILDVRETADGLEVTAELPGVQESDVDLRLEGELLVLRGEKREQRQTEEGGVHLQERSFGRFQRALRLPFAPDPQAVTANFEHGVLRILLPRPKPEAGRDRRIPIRGSGEAPAGGAPGAPERGTGGQAEGV
ncbi:MAG TPA: Hsp20/alpha crystallin family protein [Crenalkalicoccus sp.]|nr:Hsp20/alpha crystallin family protein [Crenalkalicoccus sp.]